MPLGLLLLAGAFCAGSADGLRILSFMTLDVPSHHMWMAPLTVRLAELGHQVHALDIKEVRDRPPTMNVSVIESAYTLIPGFTDIVDHGNVFQKLKLLIDLGIYDCVVDMETPTIKQLIADSAFRSNKFDVMLVDYVQSDCFLGLAHLFDCPVIVLTPFPANYWIDLLMGNPALPAVQSLVFLDFDTPMTFTQRLTVTVMHAYVYFVIRWKGDPAMNEINRSVFGPGIPSVEELRKRVALALINETPGMIDSARPFVPSIVPVGGMHIKQANLSHIPHHVKEWLDNAGDGFIFMSFGSMKRGSSMDLESRRSFIKAFSMINQRVLWKFETNDILSELPPNVRIDSWLPQNDILAHPNIKLFISHGGGLSIQESLYHGVPILGIPRVLDQHGNIQKVQKLGVGRHIDFRALSGDRVFTEIQEILRNPMYREKAKQLSRVMRDQLEQPLQRAVWWVEYVARHGGAPHLRSPALALPWHQILLMDVIAVLVVAPLMVLVGAVLLCRRAARCLPRRQRPRARTTTKAEKRD